MGTTIPAIIEGLARFAVDEHNKQEGLALKFQNVIIWKVNGGAVEVSTCEITLKVVKGAEEKKCSAVVWVEPDNSKELKEFKFHHDA